MLCSRVDSTVQVYAGAIRLQGCRHALQRSIGTSPAPACRLGRNTSGARAQLNSHASTGRQATARCAGGSPRGPCARAWGSPPARPPRSARPGSARARRPAAGRPCGSTAHGTPATRARRTRSRPCPTRTAARAAAAAWPPSAGPHHSDHRSLAATAGHQEHRSRHSGIVRGVAPTEVVHRRAPGYSRQPNQDPPEYHTITVRWAARELAAGCAGQGARSAARRRAARPHRK